MGIQTKISACLSFLTKRTCRHYDRANGKPAERHKKRQARRGKARGKSRDGHADAGSVPCGEYSSTCRRVLEYSPQSTLTNYESRWCPSRRPKREAGHCHPYCSGWHCPACRLHAIPSRDAAPRPAYCPAPASAMPSRRGKSPRACNGLPPLHARPGR